MAECPSCGARYSAMREDWVTCLRCPGPPPGMKWQPLAYFRAREHADEDALLAATDELVARGEAERLDDEGEQLGLAA